MCIGHVFEIRRVLLSLTTLAEQLQRIAPTTTVLDPTQAIYIIQRNMDRCCFPVGNQIHTASLLEMQCGVNAIVTAMSIF